MRLAHLFLPPAPNQQKASGAIFSPAALACKREPDAAEAPQASEAVLRQLEDDILLTMRVISNAAANTQGQIGTVAKELARAQALGGQAATLTSHAAAQAAALVAANGGLAAMARRRALEAGAALQLVQSAEAACRASLPRGDALAQEARRVDSAVQKIEAMSRQGAFLALNASLEAARIAGANGRFSAIANESKHLAEGIRAASSDLVAGVGALRLALAQNCDATETLQGRVERMQQTVADLRRGCEAQTQASEAAQSGFAHHSKTLFELNAIATQLCSFLDLASTGAMQSRQSGGAMTALLARLTRRSVVFLRNSSHGDRRMHMRVPIKAPGMLAFGARQRPVMTLEIARAGCILVPTGHQSADPLAPGDHGMLHLEGVGAVPVTILATSELGWHTRFTSVTDAIGQRVDRLIAQTLQDSAPVMRLTQETAAEVERLFRHGLDAADVLIDELLTVDYQPIAGTDPVQYAAPALNFYERVLPPVLEAARASPVQPLFVLATDRNAYAPVHHPEFSQAQRLNQPQWNDLHARHRRIYDRWLTLIGARNRAPCSLRVYIRHLADGSPLPIQVIAAPVYVRGHFWGNVQIGCNL